VEIVKKNSKKSMNITCELLDHRFTLDTPPKRVISLVSGLTEALFDLGCGDRIAGVSTYCNRYVPNLEKPIAGDYLRIDEELFEALNPDLVLVTAGIQLNLARKLAARELPVYALPLPGSIHGILENILTLGALMHETRTAHTFAENMTREIANLANSRPEKPSRVYIELWFGKHMRTIGGRTFIHDIVSLAGGDPVFADIPEAYPEPDLDRVAKLAPDTAIFFQEPDYPVNVQNLLKERGWENLFPQGIIESTVERGKNLIHDGPSALETARWLATKLSP
jgi:iron complex transport system substrate-binding protein